MFWLIIWLIQTTDKTYALHAVIFIIFLMYFNQSLMLFFDVIYSVVCINHQNHFVILYIFNTTPEKVFMVKLWLHLSNENN